MKDLLEELYYLHEEGVTIKGKSANIITKTENKLIKKLKGKNKELFCDYEMAYSEFNAITAVESFKLGFKTGFEFNRELSEM